MAESGRRGPSSSSELRVVHLARYFHPVVGGTENFIAGLAHAVAPLGIHSTVLCSTRGATRSGPAPDVPVLRVPTIGPDRLQAIRRITPDVRALVADADVLHFHDLRFGFDLRRRLPAAAAKPSVFHTHGLIFHTDRSGRLKRLMWRRVWEPALASVDVVVADSAADLEYVASIPRARLIPNPVAVDNFLVVGDTPRDPHGPLLYFGRLASNKGLERLVPILRRLPNHELVIVGTGAPREVRELTRAFAGLPVRFAGALGSDALLAELRRCSAVVLPSRTEGFGITLVEAMATGRPVVASAIPTYREIAEGTEVALVEFDDVDAVLQAINVGENAQTPRSVARARSYSWVEAAPHFAALYREVMSSHHRTTAH